MSMRRRQDDEAEFTSAGCWRSPRGKLLSKQDRIRVCLPGNDLSALHRAVDATMSHLDEARGRRGAGAVRRALGAAPRSGTGR